MELIKMIIAGLFDPHLVTQIADTLLALEALILGLIGIFGGAGAVKRYKESKFQQSLHRAIETAVGLSPDRQAQRAYVRQSVPDALKGLLRNKTPAQIDSQLNAMLQSYETLRKIIK